MIYNKIRDIDLIGRNLGLNYEGNKVYKSMIGAIMSLLIISLFLVGLIYFGMELFIKESPIIISSTNYNQMPSNTSLSPTNFPFYVAVEDPTNNLNYFKDDRIFEMKARKYTRITTLDSKNNSLVNVTKKFIDLEDCKLERHFPSLESSFGLDALKSAYCVKPEDNLYIKGDFNVNEFYEIQFFLYPCYNTTENKNKCKSQKEINDRLTGYVNYKYIFYYNTPNDYENPVKKESSNFFSTISPGTYKKQYSYLKKVFLTTDSGVVFQDKHTDSFTQVDNNFDNLQPYTVVTGDYIWSMDIRMSYNEDFYTRSYLKIQNLLAILGGLYSGLLQITILLYNFLFNHLFWIDLINKNFHLDSNKRDIKMRRDRFKDDKYFKNKSENSGENRKVLESNLPMVNQFFNNMESPMTKINDQKKEKLSDVMQNYKKKNHLSISIFTYFKQFFICCFYKNKHLNVRNIYYMTRNFLQKMLDINNIVKKQIEFERLKFIKLDDEDYKLFHYLSNPSINSLTEDYITDPFFNLVLNCKPEDHEILKLLVDNNKIENSKKKIFELFDIEFLNGFK